MPDELHITEVLVNHPNLAVIGVASAKLKTSTTSYFRLIRAVNGNLGGSNSFYAFIALS